MIDRFNSARQIFKKHQGILRTSQAISLGVAPATLYAMHASGALEKVSRGVYRLSDYPQSGSPDLMTVGMCYPKAVICLISALDYYELTTHIPHAVYIALPQDAEMPRLEHPPLEIIWLSPKTYEAGIETLRIDSVAVKIYDREKTITDCFKFRKKYGLEVAVEALKNYLDRPKSDWKLEKLMYYAKINRVEKVMAPYLEALL